MKPGALDILTQILELRLEDEGLVLNRPMQRLSVFPGEPDIAVQVRGTWTLVLFNSETLWSFADSDGVLRHVHEVLTKARDQMLEAQWAMPALEDKPS